MAITAGRPDKLCRTVKILMRFDTPVTFRVVESTYNAETGNYANEITSETVLYASVSGTTERIMTLVYGGARQDSITARFQNHVNVDYTDIVVNGKAYKVDYIAPKRVKDVFVLSRV